ncbi:DUF3224 domain-containing protein [Aquincola sp. S2]|uniref:DUF3224 domain-containing protein n=1 Tax=Pseudaquabacterium terrae TaxID=2732868 RepID=A0ABX2EQB8_9BURK|nr:DUF3224 domain-containing protein [Aquabacterium terrae]NRF70846.1 DUF3224 domain-containing protein [Aquabacterium terrae]
MTTNPLQNPTRCASGRFAVQMTSLPLREDAAAGHLGRLQLDKQFSGDLQASGRGEMLTAGTVEVGSAGYVAIEQISGTLHGRRGSFVFQHSGQMNRGAPSLSITVVPDSGTDELVGLAGTFSIDIVDGQHFYRFDYVLP